ncbi:MAG: hypothetical protein WA021_02565 [Minisyncoccia bacterium]
MNQNTNSSTSSATTVSNLLQQLAFGTTTATASNNLATSVPLVITGAQAGTLAYVSGQQPQQSTSSLGAIGGIAATGQNTFTSNDLRWQPQQPLLPGGERYSRLVTLYSQLRDVLTRMINYLQPFSGARRIINLEGS